ncbi:hypothetical protein QCA50_019827 [Cerrena zonata]|uniref:Uncharacterized protein n=1 Tax=Cerrena zonata TaxID=2478898 RepID=A0AAW0FA15_9APHY
MESLNMNILANSLPNSNLANAEAELTNNFKAAALSLTTLYKTSKKTSKRAYNAGYSAACHDLLLMIQQGVSAGESSEGGGGMTIGRIMDYIEARLEAIRSQEEEEDEDEERERAKVTTAPVRPVNAPKGPLPQAVAALRSKEQQQQPFSAPLTPRTHGNMPATPTSPSPFRPSSAPTLPSSNLQRAMKSRLSATNTPQKDISLFSPNPSTSFNPDAADREPTIASPVAIYPPISMSPTEFPLTEISTGMKRPRHAAMMLDAASGISPGTARRRSKSHRGIMNLQDQNQSQVSEEMDIEEEGRERKRVARR